MKKKKDRKKTDSEFSVKSILLKLFVTFRKCNMKSMLTYFKLKSQAGKKNDFCWDGHEVLLNSKLHIDWRKAEFDINCLLFNNTSCSLKEKSTIVSLYEKVERPVIGGIKARFRLTLLHKPCDVTSQTLLEATSPSMRIRSQSIWHQVIGL